MPVMICIIPYTLAQKLAVDFNCNINPIHDTSNNPSQSQGSGTNQAANLQHPGEHWSSNLYSLYSEKLLRVIEEEIKPNLRIQGTVAPKTEPQNLTKASPILFKQTPWPLSESTSFLFIIFGPYLLNHQNGQSQSNFSTGSAESQDAAPTAQDESPEASPPLASKCA